MYVPDYILGGPQKQAPNFDTFVTSNINQISIYFGSQIEWQQKFGEYEKSLKTILNQPI